MFTIRDKNTKNIWFTGTVYEPKFWENEKRNYEKSCDLLLDKIKKNCLKK